MHRTIATYLTAFALIASSLCTFAPQNALAAGIPSAQCMRKAKTSIALSLLLVRTKAKLARIEERCDALGKEIGSAVSRCKIEVSIGLPIPSPDPGNRKSKIRQLVRLGKLHLQTLALVRKTERRNDRLQAAVLKCAGIVPAPTL